MFQKSHFGIHRCVIPPPEDTLENFYMGAQLQSFWHIKASKVDLKVYALYWFQCMHAYCHCQLLSTTSTDLITHGVFM